MPVITLDTSNSILRDNCVYQSQPNTVMDHLAQQIPVGLSLNNGSAYRGLLYFDLGLLPNDALIANATLTLSRYTYQSAANKKIEVEAVATEWEQESVTWANQPAGTNVKVTFETDPLADSTINVNVTNIVRGWSDGTLKMVGFRLKYVSETIGGQIVSGDRIEFYSSNAPSTSVRPKLTIDYVAPTGDKKAVENVGAVSVFEASSSSISLQPHASTKAGDLMIATVINNVSNFGLVAPSGWTKISETVTGSARTGYYHKRATASEPAAIFTSTNSSANISGWGLSIDTLRNVKAVKETAGTPYHSNVFRMIAPATSASTTKNYAFTSTVTNAVSASIAPDNLSTKQLNARTFSGAAFESNGRYMYSQLKFKDNYSVITFGSQGVGEARVIFLEPTQNEPPTPPSNVTVDKIEYTVGDTIKINYSPGVDPNGDPVSYRLYQQDGETGAWKYLDTTTLTNPSIICQPMIDTNVSKVGVMSIDDKNSMSTVAESAPFSVKQKNGDINAPTEVASGSFSSTASVPVMRFANGWLGYVVRSSSATQASIVLSKDQGKTWILSGDINGSFLKGLTAIANENMLYVVYPSNATTISAVALDVTTLTTNSLITKPATTVLTVVDTQGLSVAFDKTNNKLLVASASKTPTNQASFNVFRNDVTLNSVGEITGVTYIGAITSHNLSNSNCSNVSIDVAPNGAYEYVVFRESTGGLVYFAGRVLNKSTSMWSAIPTISAGVGNVTNPQVAVTPDGKVHTFGAITINDVSKAIYRRSIDNGATWSAYVDLGACWDTSMSVAPDNKVHVYIINVSYIYHTYSNDGFITFPSSTVRASDVQGSYINATSSFRDASFRTKFTVPPSIYRRRRSYDNAQMLSFFGRWEVAKQPTVTLTSPADNLELIEGMSYTIAGQAKSEMSGTVIVVNTSFFAGNVPIGTFVSDGVTPYNFSKTFTYKNKQMFDGNTPVSPILAENKKHVANTHAVDTTNNLTSDIGARFFTVKYNMAPVISGTDQDLGAFMQIPSVNYSATDPEGNTFTFSEYLNGKQIRSFTGVAGQQYTVEISHDAWIRLDLDMQHQIKIVATDSAGVSSERIYTFTRTETHIEFLLEYGNPDIKADFTLDGMPLRVLVTLERYLPEGSSIESVKVCNNYLDDVPTWEDCTNAVKVNRGYLFTNKNKTAPEWAINLWVTIDKGTAKERVLVNGYGGAFD
ncbi:DNRLRE domain-containing protein [Brevibacillus sp. DP1.3A]|uniref:DNRLRE domain-containing protein n=1 Tax=Brevibacillus sp. DP1.3A TaxID=2738867 RepID=UPI00156BA4BB|nr:DNRLRE domain-containing protein [Brevibacillus sp. DP1.3A]UED75826.1 DNRLRE domain-containing protein [Brevibacillus sp. DP1.3A]